MGLCGCSEMPLKCYQKPNRTKVRTFTAKDVGRIACYAIDDGALKSDVRREVDKCLGPNEECEHAFSVLEVILKLLLALALALFVLSTLQRLVRVLLILRRILPKEIVEALEDKRIQQLEEEVKIRIDEVTELILARKGPGS